MFPILSLLNLINKIWKLFYNTNELNKFIKVHKDPCPHISKNNVVYKILYKNCDVFYVGQIDRTEN